MRGPGILVGSVTFAGRDQGFFRKVSDIKEGCCEIVREDAVVFWPFKRVANAVPGLLKPRLVVEVSFRIPTP